MAHTLDEYLEFDTWKAVVEDNFYDWKLVNKVRRSLRTLREKGDVRGLLGVLEMCVKDNFGGVESARCVTLITPTTLSHISTGCTARCVEIRRGRQIEN